MKSGFLFGLLMIAIYIISVIAIIGIAIGCGWVLQLLLPFSLFEGTLLALLAMGMCWAIWSKIVQGLMSPLNLPNNLYDEELDEDVFPEIPQTRFWKKPHARTWEKWITYTLANTIYDALLDLPEATASMPDQEVQDMSVNLAEAAMHALKTKQGRSKQLRVNRGELVQQMARLGHPPYDEEILALTIRTVNEELIYLNEPVLNVIKHNLWQDLSDMI